MEGRRWSLRHRLDIVERSARLILAIVGLLSLSSCISYETGNNHSQIDNPHATTIFAEILTGQTTAAWLQQRLGTPSQISDQGDGEALWRYDNITVTNRLLKVVPLFEVSHTEHHQQYFYFEIENDLIVSYWTVDSKDQGS